MRKIIIFIAVLVITLTLSACSVNNDLESIGLDGMNGKEILTDMHMRHCLKYVLNMKNNIFE